MLDHTHTHSLNHSLTYYVTHSHTQLILWPSTHGLILLPGMQVPGLSASFWQCCWSRWRQVLSGPPMADIMLGQTRSPAKMWSQMDIHCEWLLTEWLQWLWVTTMTVSDYNVKGTFVEECTKVSAHQIFYNLVAYCALPTWVDGHRIRWVSYVDSEWFNCLRVIKHVCVWVSECVIKVMYTVSY